jgi:transposase
MLEKDGNCVVIADEDEVYIGLDVHRRRVNVCVRHNGAEVASWVSPPQPEVIVSSLMPLKEATRKVVYEAGPTGYGLYRALKAAGFPAEVWPAGKMMREANGGNKSDRLDARALALHAEKGLMECPVAVPTEREEAERQLMRTREQVVKKLRRVKQQIKSFLTMHGAAEPEGLEHWSKKSVAALRELALAEELQVCLGVLVDELEHLDGLRRRLERKLGETARSQAHAEDEQRLRTHPGVARLTAMNFILEIFRPERFEVQRQLTKLVGLAPSVRQSGESRRGGPVAKTGQESLRRMLVQAAWQWIRQDQRALGTYRRLVRNTGSAQKAIVGMARRLCVNLWCMLRRGENYRPGG